MRQVVPTYTSQFYRGCLACAWLVSTLFFSVASYLSLHHWDRLATRGVRVTASILSSYGWAGSSSGQVNTVEFSFRGTDYSAHTPSDFRITDSAPESWITLNPDSPLEFEIGSVSMERVQEVRSRWWLAYLLVTGILAIVAIGREWRLQRATRFFEQAVIEPGRIIDFEEIPGRTGFFKFTYRLQSATGPLERTVAFNDRLPAPFQIGESIPVYVSSTNPKQSRLAQEYDRLVRVSAG